MVTTGTKQKVLEIYTDGSCDYKTGLGGYAFTYGTVEDGKRIRISGSGSDKETTVNRMELMAAIQALNHFKLPEQVIIYSDSKYVVSPFTEGWIYSMDSLKPFFCYYGGKWRSAPRYPKPVFDKIVEPFAGGAGYSLRYYQSQITLYEVDPTIYSLWKYLITVPSSEIMSLPEKVDNVDDIACAQEAKWLIGFWLNKATTQPSKKASTWAKSGIRPNSYWGPVVRDRLAAQVEKIRHWKVYNQSYDTATDEDATWFVDPPYQNAVGRYYRHNEVDFGHLGKWCQSRKGQIIVCEQAGANWLPFAPFAKIKANGGSRGKGYSEEVIWYKSTYPGRH